MLFNSFSYALFLPLVFLLYWFVFKKTKQQNILLLLASYYFYGSWDWRFLFLLLFSTGLDFFTGIQMSSSTSEQKRKFWFWLSIVINLGFLGAFKYYNFFITSFSDFIGNLGFRINVQTLNIILPVGISFYTFHGLSYVIDIYYKRIDAERKFVDYAVFVSFFPLLVAGPIERATHLLPQIKRSRVFDYTQAVSGLRQILWGLFKKIVIADNCAVIADQIFDQSNGYTGIALALGAILFAFQIYGDFSGYSDIALGSAKLFGINLLKNFATPYFSRDIAEFWRRWHISLSTWFRDYVYIPMGGNKGTLLHKVRNTFTIFVISGFWHGANWTFIAWGALNALYFIPYLLANKNRVNIDIVAKGKHLPSLRDVFNISLTFIIVTIAWIFFRAENIEHALAYISSMVIDILSATAIDQAYLILYDIGYPVILLVMLFILIEWIGREEDFALAKISQLKNQPLRYVSYYFITCCVFWYAGNEQQFIYFQF